MSDRYKNIRRAQTAAQRPTKAQMAAFHTNFNHEKARVTK